MKHLQLNHWRRLTALVLTAVLAATQQAGAQTTNQVEELTIEVITPGTFGDLVLAQTQDFTDVKKLTVSGTLDSDDFYSLSKRMTNLRTLDMSGVKTETLSNNFFEKMDSLTTCVLPQTLTVVPSYAFWQLKVLSSVTIPDGVTIIESNAFYRCPALESITLPAALTTIKNSAFQYAGLKSIDIPDGVTTIENYAFQYCDSLRQVHLPAALTTLGVVAFGSCKKLQNVTLPEGLPTLPGSTFSTCESLTEIVIPASVTEIGGNAFYDCKRLERVTLSEGLLYIREGAFRNTALREFTYPSTVQCVEEPLIGCNQLERVVCLAVNPPSARKGIYGTNKADLGRDTIYVPAVSLTAYKQQIGWDEYTLMPVDELPQHLWMSFDQTLNLPDELPDGYKPDMVLQMGYDYRYTSHNAYPCVTVNGTPTLSLSNFSTEWDAYRAAHGSGISLREDKAYGALIVNAPMRADAVSVSFHTYLSSQWLFFVLPFNARVADMELALGSDYSICEYSSANRAAAKTDETWQRVAPDATLVAGRGYIIRCSKYYEIVTFHAINDEHKNDIFRNTEAEVQLEEHLGEFAHNRSWNFIGNPYPAYYDIRFMEFDAPVVVWEWGNGSSNYVTYSPLDDGYVLSPGQAFFVQRPLVQSSIVFPLEGRQGKLEARDLSAAAPRRAASAEVRSVYNLTLTDGQNTDRTRLVLNAGMTLGYDYGRDAAKFMSLDAAMPQLYTVADDVRYAINERPEADGLALLGMQVAQAGDYTIAMQTRATEPLLLTDLLTGQRTLLTDGASYTFSAEAGTTDGRFLLQFGGTTAIQSVSAKAQPAAGQPVYNLNGQRVAQPARGIYIIGGKKHVVK